MIRRGFALAWLASTAAAVTPLDDANFFPTAVWCQDPVNATRYQDAGINLYVALWKGPTEEQLATLKAAGMPVVCEQNAVGLRHLKDPVIAGWMHGDEPDNAQSLGEGKGWGLPVQPKEIVAEYRTIKARDPSRPVLLNLGQGVAWDGWYGRNVPAERAAEFAERAYVPGGDIVSFDIYPAVHDRPEVAGKLWYVAQGVERLRAWCAPRQRVWSCIEASRIGNVNRKPTPDEIRAEVWMAVARGATGIIYFVHQFAPTFVEASLLGDPELLAAVREINRELHELAPFLNGRPVPGLKVAGAPASVPVAATLRRFRNARCVIAANLRDETVMVKFTLPGAKGWKPVDVPGEGRHLDADKGVFTDGFAPWAVHVYRIED